MDWDDLKYLVAVAEVGTVDAAARALKVAPPAVDRQLHALEVALNCELVSTTAHGIQISASGKRAVEVGRQIAALVKALAEEVGGERGELSGMVSVTSTAGFVPKAMTALDPLRAKYPALRIDVMVSSHVVDLRRKEADIAVRMFRDQQDGLELRKLGTMGWSLYGGKNYLDGHKSGANLLDGHKVIGYDSMFTNTAGGRWLAANAKEDSIAIRVGGIRQALDAAAAGKGVCIVPCYLAAEHDVVRVTDDVLTTNDVFAVYLAERSSEARMRVVTDALAELFVREQSVFAGALGAPSA